MPLTPQEAMQLKSLLAKVRSEEPGSPISELDGFDLIHDADAPAAMTDGSKRLSIMDQIKPIQLTDGTAGLFTANLGKQRLQLHGFLRRQGHLSRNKHGEKQESDLLLEERRGYKEHALALLQTFTTKLHNPSLPCIHLNGSTLWKLRKRVSL